MLTKIPDYKWNVDNFGPIIIPKKGWTVKLDSMTFPLYERCIEVYENNKLEVNGKDILINGKKTDSYTFKMNYYWMMGDNRHDSQDARYFGFVPEDHIVGKAWFIWMSLDGKANWLHKIRWSRIFSSSFGWRFLCCLKVVSNSILSPGVPLAMAVTTSVTSSFLTGRPETGEKVWPTRANKSRR